MTTLAHDPRPAADDLQRAAELEIQILGFRRDAEAAATAAMIERQRVREMCAEARSLIDQAEETRYFSEMTKQRAALELEEQRRFSETVEELREWIERARAQRSALRRHPHSS